jgi:hypothetical protein
MLTRFMRRNTWRVALAALVLPLALGACDGDDPSDPDDDPRNGLWAFTEDGITNYVRITDNEIEIFDNSGTCFLTLALGIESRDGDVFVVDTGGANVTWTIEEVGNNIVVEDDEGVSRTLIPSSVNTSTLTQCEPFDPETDDFPHASCASLALLGLPGTVTGDLVPGDARWSDSTWYELYRMNITTVTDVNLTMTADDQADLDSYLIVTDASGDVRWGEDDDGADGSDARVQTTLDPGCYIVVAGSWQGADAGDTGGGYTLTSTTTLVSDFPHATCTAIPEVTVGGSVSGTLEDGDTRWSDDSWYDLWSLQLDTEQTVTITMEEDGSGIDTYMMLYNSLGTLEIDADDDIDGTNFNSQILDITLEPGCYIIVANSYEGDDVGEVGGDYTVSVD